MLNWNPLGNGIPAAVWDGAHPGDLNAELIKNLGPRAGGNGPQDNSCPWAFRPSELPAVAHISQSNTCCTSIVSGPSNTSSKILP